ncbi:MAG: cobyrinate a,c-diamide synthase, partial [Clostridia bacterium]|nr:cobyrinate a,c-diamide synthase [Clostridia bacterium]
VTGLPCTNLDPFFCDENLLKTLLCRENQAQITVIEGVMGYYDGTGADGAYSTYSVASATKTPVVLVANAKGASASLLATLSGFLDFMPDSRICGVLFNRATEMQYQTLARWTRERFGDRLRPLGYLPLLPPDCVIPSRHLGLVTANEIADLRARLEKTADLCEKTVDLDGLLALANTAPDLEYDLPKLPHFDRIDLAVARDDAFCFYYDAALRLLCEMGAALQFFSPLANEPLPQNCDGLLLGGGYPELYAKKLAANTAAGESIKAAVLAGLPTIAECGGFQYLGQKLCGEDMCGVLPHLSENTGKLVRFGYLTLTAKTAGLFGGAGTRLRAHEFHYFDSSENGDGFTAEKPSGKRWDTCVYTDTLYAGYPHLFLPANPAAAAEFYKKCLRYKENRV